MNIYISFATKSLKMKLLLSIFFIVFNLISFAQTNEFVGNGADIYVAAGAEVHIFGDFSISSGTLTNDGLIQTRGNSYSNTTFQQRGTGTYRIDNSDYNQGNRQFISGSFAVRGGQTMTGVDDGSFYNLELNNDQGIVYLVGSGFVADVRNAVNFQAGSILNRIVTHDIGITGVITNPGNGSGYNAVFGVMNPTAGFGSMLNNTITLSGNNSGVDAGYVQGKFRRAINSSGGVFQFPLGLQPAGTGAQMGVQYAYLNLGVNDYDYISGFFFRNYDNSFALDHDCSGYGINYFGGPVHGAWYFAPAAGVHTGNFSVRVWPQDDNYTTHSVWVITRNQQLDGTPDQCGPSPIGLERGGFTDNTTFGYFSLAAGDIYALSGGIQIAAQPLDRSILVSWNTQDEFEQLNLYRSTNGVDFEFIGDVIETAQFEDFDIEPHQIYYYKLIGNEGYSNEQSSTIVSASLQSGAGNVNDIVIYPNPSSEYFNLRINTAFEDIISYRVINTIGQQLASEKLHLLKGMNGIQIDAYNWLTGVYFLEIIDENQETIKTIKLIKQ